METRHEMIARMAKSRTERTGCPPTRREERRRATVDEIKRLARAQLNANGYGGLSLRAVAREMRMSSPAVFRYFPNQSDLITALCVDAYTDLADTLGVARERDAAAAPIARMGTVFSAFRGWALANPADFALIHGTPIPGYHAPESATGPAAARTMATVLETYLDALGAGAATIDGTNLPDNITLGGLGARLLEPHNSALTALTPAAAAAAHSGWAAVLGFVISELWGNLPNLVSDTDVLFAAHLRTVLRSMGFHAGIDQ
ncbi:TetR family transcriptional regulator [Mycobacteroides abscessus subsp. massiliense]|nr:TetR family transcriptional regulator [Mycobacteroides abscessus subsp. massiliense]SKU18862.1 TetR family transcriptional regulator [Mycobacteroides abscessus subsp. massiliense]